MELRLFNESCTQWTECLVYKTSCGNLNKAKATKNKQLPLYQIVSATVIIIESPKTAKLVIDSFAVHLLNIKVSMYRTKARVSNQHLEFQKTTDFPTDSRIESLNQFA